jgi:hypothetical protein
VLLLEGAIGGPELEGRKSDGSISSGSESDTSSICGWDIAEDSLRSLELSGAKDGYWLLLAGMDHKGSAGHNQRWNTTDR